MRHLTINYDHNRKIYSILNMLYNMIFRYKRLKVTTMHVFTDEELQVFIQKIEKQVYNSIACAKIKGSC